MLGIQIKIIFCILHLGRLSPWLFLNLKIIVPSFWGLCFHTMVLRGITLKLREVPESMCLFSFDQITIVCIRILKWSLQHNEYYLVIIITNTIIESIYYKLKHLLLNLLTSCSVHPKVHFFFVFMCFFYNE
jgi:ABC-type branched-subunit amino acid transport system permease subunit